MLLATSFTFQSDQNDSIQESSKEPVPCLILDAEMSIPNPRDLEEPASEGTESLSSSDVSEFAPKNLDPEDFQGSTQSLPPNTLGEELVPSSLKVRSLSHNDLNYIGSSSRVRKHSIYKISFQTEQDETTEVTVDRLSRGDYVVSGDVYIQLKHAKETLFVTIVEGRNFPATNKKGYSNPYIKLYLLPDLKGSKQKTKVEKKTLSPFYNQTFHYPLPKKMLHTRAVWLSVWSKTTLSQQFIGETCIALASTNLPKTTYKQWLPLEDYPESGMSQTASAIHSEEISLSSSITSKCTPVVEHSIIDENGEVVITVTYSIPLISVFSEEDPAEKTQETRTTSMTELTNPAEDNSSISVNPAEEDSIIVPAKENGSIILQSAEKDLITLHPAKKDSIILNSAEKDGSIFAHLPEENESNIPHSTEIDSMITTDSTIQPIVLHSSSSLKQDDNAIITECSVMPSSVQPRSIQDIASVNNSLSSHHSDRKEEKISRERQQSLELNVPPVLTINTQSDNSQEDSIKHIVFNTDDETEEIDINSSIHTDKLPVKKGTENHSFEYLNTKFIQTKIDFKDFRGSTQSLSSTVLGEELSVPSSLKVRSFSQNDLNYIGSSSRVRKHSTYKISFPTEQDETTEVTVDRLSRGNYVVSGDVYVRIKHVKETLFVTIVEGRNFPATNKKGCSNPYIKLYLLPDLKGSKQKTKVEKRTLNPYYNQTFQYPLPKKMLHTRAVWLSVWSKTTLSQQFIGETCIALASTNLPKKTYKQWLPLEDFSESMPVQHDTDELFTSNLEPPVINIEDGSDDDPAERSIHSKEESDLNFISSQSSVEDKTPHYHEFPPNLDPAEKQTLIDLFSSSKKNQDFCLQENKNESNSCRTDDFISKQLSIELEGHSLTKPSVLHLSTDTRGELAVRVASDLQTIPEEAFTLSLYLSDSDADSDTDNSSLVHKFDGNTPSKKLSKATEQHNSYGNQASNDDSIYLTRKRSQYKIASQVEQIPQHFNITINRVARGNCTISGDVYVRIKHVKETLFVTIVEGRNFPATNKKGYSNPYIKLYLLPDLKGSKQKTKVDKKTCHPLYNQTFEYPLPKEMLHTSTVWLSVWSKTTLSQQFIGETCIALASTNLPETTYKQWLPLEDFSESGMSQTASAIHSKGATSFPSIM